MTTNPLPDLSKWHEVPADADIPADTLYAWQDTDGTWGASGGLAGIRYVASARATGTRYFTAEPIPAPRSADFAWAEYRKDYEPNPAQLTAAHKAFMAGWAAAASEWPRNTDPLNENDHRDRIDEDGDRWRWIDGMWHIDGDGHLPRVTLGKVVRYAGPLRFADEVQS